jgi:hypothetical protein
MLVDLCGYGASLPVLATKTSQPQVPILIVVKYSHPIPNRSEAILDKIPEAFIEYFNFAPHPMVVDVTPSGEPVYRNYANLDWSAIPEIQVMGNAFSTCIQALKPFTVTQSEQVMIELMHKLLRQMYEHPPGFCKELLWKEEHAILADLKGLKN